MSSIYHGQLTVSIFGQSHAPAIGVTVDGLPAGEAIDLEELQAFLNRRAPGRGPWATTRKEEDRPEILSGLAGGYTCGAPLAALIRNTNTRSGDYDNLRDIPRPGHADYTAYVKYGNHHDVRGGGHFSGRLTAPLVFAGAIARQLLALCPAFDCLDEYRARCFVPGHWLTVCTGTETYAAQALSIDDAGRLVVQREGGRTEALRCGEVTTRPARTE